MVNGTLGTIDPTMMQNGFYDVRLTVEDTSGQVTTADEVYQVDGQAKIGNFTLSFQDVNIPNAGLPDHRHAHLRQPDKDTSGDFGYGWSLSVTQHQGRDIVGAGRGIHPDRDAAPAVAGRTRWAASAGSAASAGFGGLPGIGLPPGLASRPAEIQYSFQNTQNDLRDDLPARRDEGTVHHGLHGGDLQLRRPAAGDDEHLLRPARRARTPRAPWRR